MDLNSLPESDEKFDPSLLDINIKEEKIDKSERDEKPQDLIGDKPPEIKEDEDRMDEEEDDLDKSESKSKKRTRKPRPGQTNINTPSIQSQRPKRKKK